MCVWLAVQDHLQRQWTLYWFVLLEKLFKWACWIKMSCRPYEMKKDGWKMKEKIFRDCSPYWAQKRRPMTDVTSPSSYSLHRLFPVPAPHHYIYISYSRLLRLRTRHHHRYTLTCLPRCSMVLSRSLCAEVIKRHW